MCVPLMRGAVISPMKKQSGGTEESKVEPGECKDVQCMHGEAENIESTKVQVEFSRGSEGEQLAEYINSSINENKVDTQESQNKHAVCSSNPLHTRRKVRINRERGEETKARTWVELKRLTLTISDIKITKFTFNMGQQSEGPNMCHMETTKSGVKIVDLEEGKDEAQNSEADIAIKGDVSDQRLWRSGLRVTP